MTNTAMENSARHEKQSVVMIISSATMCMFGKAASATWEASINAPMSARKQISRRDNSEVIAYGKSDLVSLAVGDWGVVNTGVEHFSAAGEAPPLLL